MDKQEIIKNIAQRSGGDIYLGVVGAVRTGKSTFIKRMVETLIVPHIEDEYERKRALDEIPQSAAGKTIMTTEPKFVPNNTAKIKIDDFTCNIRLIDCVGYMIDKAIGATDENGPRMVKTPWYNEEIPFIEAAEIGTEKVIKDHSTIGIVITTDGSIGEFERNDYLEAEQRVIEELKSIGKPFIVILNSTHPTLPETQRLSESLKEEYQVPVLPISIEAMNEKDMYDILREALYEFPVLEVKVNMPEWITILNPDHPVKENYINAIRESVIEIDKLKDIEHITDHFLNNEMIEKAYLSEVDPATGIVTINLTAPANLYNKTLTDIIKIDVKNKADLLALFQEFNIAKKEYDQIKYALKMVKQTGYGVATPSIEDMKLDKPEIIKQGPRYGVKLKAVAPSIHMIRVDVESTFEPIIGSEIQSKELIDYLTKDKEKSPNDIWKSEIFGRSLDSIVQEGIQAKINMMPDNIRLKLQTTLAKVVNKGSSNIIAIVI
ncbi:MAG TPA: stage IV sporulation protein A [Candidatus Faecimonas gallistercoris]|nr:stage IV sporulation protein A [Candidatus Faecimonas gallistercoris]